MADLLIRNGYLVTMDPQRRVIAGGAVAISGDRIVAVGDSGTLSAAYPSHRVIDATRKAILPGLIDVHAHAGHGLIKTLGLATDSGWEDTCHTAYTIASDAEFWAVEASLSALERLRGGTTTGVSYLGGGDDVMRTDDPIYADAHCRAIEAIGTSSVVAVGINRPPFPVRYRDLRTGADLDVTFAHQLEVCERVAEDWHTGADGRVRIAVSFPVHHRNSAQDQPETYREVADQAAAVRDLTRRRSLMFTQDGHREGSIRIAHEEFNLLGPDALMSHTVDIDAEEIRLIAETGTRVAHNPSANRSVTGRCPVPELIEAGAVVGLGSDGTAPDRSADMFRHMFQCMHYHRRHFRNASVLPPGKMLEMVTIDGATALGMDAEIGSLEVGKRADVILVDLFKPHMVPANMPLYRLTNFAVGSDVDTTIVAGRVLMEGRKLADHIDEPAILEDAERQAALLLERTGLHAMTALPERFWGVAFG
jgi:cytosine/adenosine deaminase-related metal-dependent hydrolase